MRYKVGNTKSSGKALKHQQQKKRTTRHNPKSRATDQYFRRHDHERIVRELKALAGKVVTAAELAQRLELDIQSVLILLRHLKERGSIKGVKFH
jgi:ribosomal protein S25